MPLGINVYDAYDAFAFPDYNGDVSLSDVLEDVALGYTNSFHIPDEFVLLLSSREGPTEGKYRVVWRLRHQVGAKLVKRV